jgi:hypothetical protein
MVPTVRGDQLVAAQREWKRRGDGDRPSGDVSDSQGGN